MSFTFNISKINFFIYACSFKSKYNIIICLIICHLFETLELKNYLKLIINKENFAIIMKKKIKNKD